MSDANQKRRLWLVVLVMVALLAVAGQAAYLYYLQRQVVGALNGVYGELAASPELNALLDLNASLPQASAPGDENAPAPAKLDESLKSLQGLLGPDSNGTIQQLLDMTRQMAETYDAASGVEPTPQPQSAERKLDAVYMPNVTLAETPNGYRLDMDFGMVNITSLTAAAKDQTIHVEGNATGRDLHSDARQPFKGSFSLNAPIDPDSLTMANAGSVYTVTVNKKAVAT